MTWLGRCSNRRSTGRLGAGGRKTSPWDEEDFFEGSKIDFFSWAVSEVGQSWGDDSEFQFFTFEVSRFSMFGSEGIEVFEKS